MWKKPFLWIWQGIRFLFQQYFVAGVLIIVPAMLTIWVMAVLVGWIDAMILAIPKKIGVETWFLFRIPGIGLIITIMMILACGMVVRNYFGRWMVNLWVKTIHRVPVMGTIYNALSQLFRSMFGDPEQRFGRVVLVPYPTKDCWALAFVTRESTSEKFQNHLGEPCANVFMPTAPNPTSGFYMVVPVKDLIPVNIKVDEAFKVIVSGGLVAP